MASTSTPSAHPESEHRSVTGGAHRAAIFGISDGLVSNVSLILGVAGASAPAEIVRVAGIAGLLAGAVSMAAGEYISMQAQRELLEAELARERHELQQAPDEEAEELARIYESRGISSQVARDLAAEIHQDLDLALETHAREELGVDPEELGRPLAAAVSSFGAFAVGALVPLVPWFLAGGGGAMIASILLAAVTALVVGAVLGRLTGRSVAWSALRQFAVAAVAAAVTYGVGTLFGVTTA